MPQDTITSADRVSLGENSLMVVGGTPQDPSGGDIIRFVQGVADAAAGEIDVTDNLSGGYTEVTRSPRTCRITADCFWRANDNPLSWAPNFQEGELTAAILLWPDYENDPESYFGLETGFCVNYTVTVAGAAEVRFSVALRNEGPYVTPSS